MGSSQLLTAFFKSKITRIGLVIAATTVNCSLYTVEYGHRAVIFDRYRGSPLDKTVGEGTHFLIPWIQKPYIFDIRTRPHTFLSISAGTRDFHRVNVSLRVLARPNSQRLTTIFKSFGLEYEERMLPSFVSEVVRDVVGRFDAGELLAESSQLSQLSALFRDEIVERARDFVILLDDAAITHISYQDAEFYRQQEELKRQAYEEKIMQREREDIEAREKLLEAKRIAKENERKWILASRKAEEEKRAREKLEQNKERIEAHKKLLEAKQIAEENERKRILSLRKAEEEEEKKSHSQENRAGFYPCEKQKKKKKKKKRKRAILKKIEQERIEADKKLLEAKKIAKENERKLLQLENNQYVIFLCCLMISIFFAFFPLLL